MSDQKQLLPQTHRASDPGPPPAPVSVVQVWAFGNHGLVVPYEVAVNQSGTMIKFVMKTSNRKFADPAITVVDRGNEFIGSWNVNESGEAVLFDFCSIKKKYTYWVHVRNSAHEHGGDGQVESIRLLLDIDPIISNDQ